MTDLETAARNDGPDLLGPGYDDMLPEPTRSPLLRLVALNIPVVAVLGAVWHRGWLDALWADQLLGAWIGGIFAVFLWAVLALACGRDDLSRWVGGKLTLLGMLGTLHGFVLAFAAVATAGDLSATKLAIATLTHGLSIALYTSIVGLVCKLWLDVQMRWCR